MKTLKNVFCLALAVVMLASLSVAAFADNEVDAIKKAGVLTVALSPDFSPMEFVDSLRLISVLILRSRR